MKFGAEPRRTSSQDIVRAIMQLAHALKLKVVSEGVETEEQFADCAVLGCDYVQGFLISVPVDAEAAEELYREACEALPCALWRVHP